MSVARVTAIGPVAAGALVWRSGGEVQLTVMAQARFRIEPERTMTVLDPVPLVHRDRHHEDDATRSLVAAADVVPFRPRVDVWMTGHAVPPGMLPTPAMAVRLGLYRDGTVLLDKVVNVFGDRVADGAEPGPFRRLPLVYERAFGGAGCELNPVGTGASGKGAPPNLVNALQPDVPGCFAPVSRYWRQRRRYVTSEQRRDLDLAVPEVPVGLDWRYFQAAPEDQQVDRLVGDEWLVLDGVDTEWPRMRSQLPGLVGVARVLRERGGQGDFVALVVDTVAVDADRREVRVVWRGLVGVSSAEELAELRVAAGVQSVRASFDATEVDARLGSEPGLLVALTSAVRESLAGLPGVGVSDSSLNRTDVDARGERGGEERFESTLRSRVGGGARRPGALADTLTNVDIVGLRGGLGVERFGETLPSHGVVLGEDTLVQRRLPGLTEDTVTLDGGEVGEGGDDEPSGGR